MSFIVLFVFPQIVENPIQLRIFPLWDSIPTSIFILNNTINTGSFGSTDSVIFPLKIGLFFGNLI